MAAMHGVAGSLALAVGRHLIAHRAGKQVRRQGRVLGRLAAALADAFVIGGVDEADAADLLRLMERAERAELRGLKHHRLIVMPEGWPFERLAINPAQLALIAAMRLRQALEKQLARAPEARRLAQLRVVKDLEAEIVRLAHRLDQSEIAGAEALRVVTQRFAVAAAAVTPADIRELLAGDPRRSLPLPMPAAAA